MNAVREQAWGAWQRRSRKIMTPRQRLIFGGAITVAAIVVPPFLSKYLQSVMFFPVGIFVLLAIGLNVVVGAAGMLDLGYVAFFAVGS